MRVFTSSTPVSRIYSSMPLTTSRAASGLVRLAVNILMKMVMKLMVVYSVVVMALTSMATLL